MSRLVGESVVVGVFERSLGGGDFCCEDVCSSNSWRRRLSSTESSVELSLGSLLEGVERGFLVGVEVLWSFGSVVVGVLIVEEALLLFWFLVSGVTVLVELFV